MSPRDLIHQLLYLLFSIRILLYFLVKDVAVVVALVVIQREVMVMMVETWVAIEDFINMTYGQQNHTCGCCWGNMGNHNGFKL